VRLDLDRDLPPVRVDSILIQQVVLNLLRNAVQAIAEKASDRRDVIIETALAEDNLVRVAVCDSGPGVSQDLAARMFDPFVTTKPYGMGMGLAISQTIVARHGGRLWHAPAAAGGSVFQFTVPTTFAESPDGS
jgi:two-component system sensor kinase FixL